MPERLKDLGVALMGLLICSAPGIGWWLTWWILAPTGIIDPKDTVWKIATAIIWIVQIFCWMWWVYVTAAQIHKQYREMLQLIREAEAAQKTS